MGKAMEQAKEYHPELFKSARSTRSGAPSGRTPAENKRKSSLTDYKIDDPDDIRNQNAAEAMYEMIKKKSPEKAEIFKKNLLENS
jgi:hypothetical protein